MNNKPQTGTGVIKTAMATRRALLGLLALLSVASVTGLRLFPAATGLRLFPAGPTSPGARSSVDAFRAAFGTVQTNTTNDDFDPSAALSEGAILTSMRISMSTSAIREAVRLSLAPCHSPYPFTAGTTKDMIALQHKLIEECELDECCLVEECSELEQEIEKNIAADDHMDKRFHALKRISSIKKAVACIQDEIATRLETLETLESQRKCYVAMLWDDRGSDHFDL